jgi:tRNA(Ile)-lysidine synthase
VLSEQAAALLSRCAFPPPGSAVACAVSGGPDSLALMVLAIAQGCRVTAYHVDHGLRAGSAEEADIVRQNAQVLGADFVGLRVEVAPGANLEARARGARFSALPPDVATGHTADDQAETVLLNLLRGAASDGLVGMRFGARHPILRLRREETERLVESMRLEVVRDPSNRDRAFRRNRVRDELLPLLSEIGSRDVVAVIARQCEILADETALLDALAAAIDATDAKQLTGAPIALARRCVRTWLKVVSGSSLPPDSASVERVLSVARGDVLACEIPGGVRISRHRGRLVAS